MNQYELELWSLLLVSPEDEREQTDEEREQDDYENHRDRLYDEAKDNEAQGDW